MVKLVYIDKPAACPGCGSKQMARIHWGMPDMSDKMKNDIDEERIVPGGCCVTDNDPAWKFTMCVLSLYIAEIDIKGSAN